VRVVGAISTRFHAVDDMSARVDDRPRWLRDRARTIAIAMSASIAIVVACTTAEALDRLDSPWTSLGVQLVSSALIGLDAAAHRVRARAALGPSIRNLSPAGWTALGVMFWIVAAPAYLIGARRAPRGDDPRALDRADAWTIAIVGAIGVAALTMGAIGSR
jgi:hypothetical protein